MVIVDSSVWIDALNQKVNPETLWLSTALGNRPVGLTSLILCEVLRGVRSDKQFLATRKQLLGFTVFGGTSTAVAVAAAQNLRTLQHRGITVRKTIDCIIATFCIQEGHELLHRDDDFGGFENYLGLQVIHP